MLIEVSAPQEPSPPAAEPVDGLLRARAARTTMDALVADRDVFETFFESARIGLALADLTGRYVRINGTYAGLLGRTSEDLIGVPLGEVLGAGEGSDVQRLLDGAASSAQSEQQYVLQNGFTRSLLHGVATVLGPDGRPAWYAVSAQDITERCRVERELRDLAALLTERAVHDPLTGLANRVLLEERLRTALARDARSGESTGALFLDLDHFKEVNDRHGHAVGDAVLCAVAERLAATVRPSDTVARVGGDEFIVLVDGATETTLGALAERLVDAVQLPVRVGTLDLDVAVSVGAALARDGEADPNRLLSAADARMYDAKRAQR